MNKKTICALLLCILLFLVVSTMRTSPRMPPYQNTAYALQRSGDDREQPERQSEPYKVYVPRFQRSVPPFVFLRSWGGELGVLDGPVDVAVHQDRVYVADIGNSRVHAFDRNGVPLTSFGVGTRPWTIEIAVDSKGDVYVPNVSEGRIKVFSADGTLLREWQDRYAYAITMDRNDRLHVAMNCFWYGAIDTYTTDGTFLKSWGTYGSGDPLYYVSDILVDEHDHLYALVDDTMLVYDSDGTLLQQWEASGSSFVMDKSNNVYLADAFSIQVFTTNGVLLRQWGTEGSQEGQLNGAQGVALDEDENVYVADRRNDRIQVFRSDGTFLRQFGHSTRAKGWLNTPTDIAVDADNNVYLVDAYHDRIQVFTADGTYLREWGVHRAGGIAVDDDRNVYVTDAVDDFVEVFDPSGTLLRRWEGGGHTEERFSSLTGIAVDENHNVYVLDTYNDRVLVFTADGTFLRQWGSTGTAEGQLTQPSEIRVNESNIYVLDSGNDRVQVFDADGTFLRQWGSSGSADGKFNEPSGIAVDRYGNVYVADTGNNRVQVFTSDGTLIWLWGGTGRSAGQFSSPTGVDVDQDGNVYVVDKDNHRLQVFAAGYPATDPVHGLVQNGSFDETPDLVHWAYGGPLPVTLVGGESPHSPMAQLGEPTPPDSQIEGEAWLRQTIYVRPDWVRPMLTFRYRMFVNDSIDRSDFYVWLGRSDNAWLADVARDGYAGQDIPPPGTDLGWRTAAFDLSAFKGQTVRLVFENRNLYTNAEQEPLGSWTYLDDVRILDTPGGLYLPITTNGQ